MRWKRIALGLALALAALFTLGAYSQVSAMSADGLVTRLRAAGATVTVEETVNDPVFAGAAGRRLSVNGVSINVYEYPTTAQLALTAARTSPDGSTVGNTQVDWVAPPHLFKSGRILVLYVGTDPTTLHLLTDTLGPQFAGASAAS